MLGIEVNFKCAKCGYSGIVDLGITNFVNYKGEKLALRSCPKCVTKNAFCITEEVSNKMRNAKLNAEGIWMKTEIIGILSNNSNITEKNEDEITNYVLNELKKEHTEEYLRANDYEVKSIIQFVITNKLYTNSYIYSEIKDECTDAGCYCY